MAFYLQLDGVDDRIQVPSSTLLNLASSFKIEVTFAPKDLAGTNKYILSRNNYYAVIWEFVNDNVEFYSLGGKYSGSDPRPGTGMAIPNTAKHTVVYEYDGTTWKGFVDGAQVFSVARTFSILDSTDTIFIGSASATQNFFAGSLYSVKIYKSAALVLHYDMTLGNQVAGTVQDQSGNGLHGTLTGGTWVADGTGGGTGTPGSVSYATKQSLYQNASAAYATKQVMTLTSSLLAASKQSIYQTGNTSYATQQNITDGGIPGSVRYATKQVIRLTSSVPFATKQAVWRTGSSQWATMQSIMDFVQIISTFDIRGEYNPILDIAGEMDSIIDILGQMQPVTVDIQGVIGLAIENAEITVYAGNDMDIRDTVKNKDGSATNLSGAAIKWSLKRSPVDKSALVVKTTGDGVAVNDPTSGVFVVSLTDTDTGLPPRKYYYTAEVTDMSGKTTTVSTGHLVIKP